MDADQGPKKLGRYDIVRVLGKGAMGIVYEGRDPNLDRRVAIKTVRVENLSDEAAAEYEARFKTEARSAARLQHPNIVSVYDSDRDLDVAFLVMEFIQGDDLKYHLDSGKRYSLEQSLEMMQELLSALDYAHRQSIVHRDIKPANLLLEGKGRIKLTDFGVARIQDSGEATRTQGGMVGTLKYMSPEQVQGQKIDARSDLFAVGVILYQLLTDKRPFDGDNDFAIMHQIIGQMPPPPSSINPLLPSAIDAVVARALAKDRDQRFPTAAEFSTALQNALRQADDTTVIPPANPYKPAESGTSGRTTAGATTPSLATGSSTTVTQELELVYWKDVKDSVDQDELRGFMARFPEGIYADLARRRLKRLTSTGDSDDKTVLLTRAAEPSGRAHDDPDATRPPPGAADVTRIVPRPAIAGVAAPTAASKPTAMPVASPSKRAPVMAAAVVAVLVVVAGAFWWTGRAPTTGTSATAPVNLPAGSASASAVAQPAVSEPVASVTAAPVASVALPVASSAVVADPRSAASAVRVAASAPAVPASVLAVRNRPPIASGGAGLGTFNQTSTPAMQAPREEPKPTPVAVAPAAAPATPAPPAPPASSTGTPPPVTVRVKLPNETCSGKRFLAFEFCVFEECAKPSFQSAPECVQLRENKRLMEDSRRTTN